MPAEGLRFGVRVPSAWTDTAISRSSKKRDRLFQSPLTVAPFNVAAHADCLHDASLEPYKP